jgi:hypothetical protein
MCLSRIVQWLDCPAVYGNFQGEQVVIGYCASDVKSLHEADRYRKIGASFIAGGHVAKEERPYGSLSYLYRLPNAISFNSKLLRVFWRRIGICGINSGLS